MKAINNINSSKIESMLVHEALLEVGFAKIVDRKLYVYENGRGFSTCISENDAQTFHDAIGYFGRMTFDHGFGDLRMRLECQAIAQLLVHQCGLLWDSATQKKAANEG